MNIDFNYRTFLGIQADDGRHDKKSKDFEQIKEWCEKCQKEFDIGGTEYNGEQQLWMCKKCKNEKRK
jgi:hypothetical protein